jgi:DNA-directed RNA polymerase subunit RPC12/RpoP
MSDVSNKHPCLMCGKEWTVAEPTVQHYFLCPDCTGHWLSDYFRRLFAIGCAFVDFLTKFFVALFRGGL